MKELARLRGGNVVLFKPDDRKYIQARMKINGNWPWWSTKQTDLEEAKFAALTHYDEQLHSPKPYASRQLFGDFCKEYSTKVLATNAKPVYSSYRSTLETWVEPFFGQMPIKQIDDETIDAYYQHLERQLGRVPAKGTINTNNIVIRSVFDLAVKRKLIKRGEMPELTIKNRGRKSIRRVDFDKQEILPLMRRLNEWIAKSETFTTRYKRQMLKYYVTMLFLTGLRPGKEIENLTWDCIDDFVDEKGKTRLRIWVQQAKKEPRKVIAHGGLRSYLPGLAALKEGRKASPWEDWTPADGITRKGQLIFAMPDGSRFKGASQMFSLFLMEYGLTFNKHGGKRSLYSWRHTYITLRLIFKKAPVQAIAANCGTSIEMISRTYSHVIPEQFAEELSQ